jgi:PIN domain nuclease of toxin-antitoxin system
MKPYILDTSAIIALIKNETGADIVKTHLKGSIMSSVNYSEAAAVLARKMPRETIISILTKLIAEVIEFDQLQAIETGILYQQTKEFGLSFGDRACLTLAKIKDLPVLTADKIWLDLNLDLEIKNIR